MQVDHVSQDHRESEQETTVNTDNRSNSSSDSEEKYFAYIYRDPKTLEVLYAGYGTRPGRAFSVGHNRGVTDRVENGEGFQILISGPYRDEQEARNVESALVSALAPDLNLIEQPGLRFRPLGVPQEYSSRQTEEHLSVHDVGRMSGGALIVYCNLTSQLKSGNEKLSPTNFGDEVILRNIREYWKVKKFIPGWVENPDSSPRALVAVQGPPSERIVVASCAIDVASWRDTPAAPWDRHVHRVPVLEDQGMDVASLRGRRVRVKFGAGPANYIMWIDGSGLVLHGYRMKGSTE